MNMNKSCNKSEFVAGSVGELTSLTATREEIALLVCKEAVLWVAFVI